jgi:hypothetical protein
MSILLWYYAAALLHESAHAIVGEILGLPAKGFRFVWGSIGIVRASGTPLANLLVSAAGPLMSLGIGILIWPYLRAFALINICLAVCNLIPIRNSDGDRVWTCLAQLGWIHDSGLPSPGLAETHGWLRSRGLSAWDLEQMELADEYPAAPGLLSLPKMEYQNYLSRPVTRNSCNQ